MDLTNHQNSSEHSEQVQPDISKRANIVIWGSFFVLVVTIYVTIVALNAYFRYEVEEEKYLKVGTVVPRELDQLRHTESQILNGDVSIIEGKKRISIEQAMNQMIEMNHRDNF